MDSLRKDKLRKYSLYAIGELVLVIAGILIALEINNASEVRKKEQRIAQIQTSVRQELELNIKELSEDIWVMEKINGGLNNMLEIIGKDTVVNVDECISDIMGMAIWKANTLALDEMVNTGYLSNFEDASLKGVINEYRRTIEDVAEHAGFMHLQSVGLMDYTAEHGNMRNSTLRMPIAPPGPSRLEHNYDFMSDPEFENRVILKFISINFTIEKYREALELMEKLKEKMG